MLKVRYSTQFKKDFKRAKKRGLPLHELKAVIEQLTSEKSLAPKHRDHALAGKYAAFRECHILPDWLLIYRIDHDVMEFIAQRTGTHSDLFDE
ncbi:type II toxin-antitoxin system YafQ family toxin [uncultured Megasphaera sp.]|uniref:type II toxin-antitoxin system YafQ family toxin n=1 Tax=uncultured Megasphaera sp. TaxID=165188 RepID=UPI00267021F5|nr:type II toxin-antitoxin system YafQ family toxin [uncultured Megasphaera sp.]